MLEPHDGMLLIDKEDGSYARAWYVEKTDSWSVTSGAQDDDSVKRMVLVGVTPEVIGERYRVPTWEPVHGMRVLDLHGHDICYLQQRDLHWGQNWPPQGDDQDWSVHSARWDIFRITTERVRDRFEPYPKKSDGG